MAGANTSLRIAELDFMSIRDNLKTYLQSQSEFQDYDFEGAGLSVLLDILSYNTHYMGYYLNMVGNEMFLDTAQLRGSILSHAKQINYIPRSTTGAKATINVTVTPPNGNALSVLTMPKYTRFVTRTFDAGNFIFSTTEDMTVTKANGVFQYSNVAITQGIPVTQSYVAYPGQSRFTIPSSNVDTSTLTVTVKDSVYSTGFTAYQMYDDLTELSANTAAYFVEETGDSSTGSYVIYFGDGTLGRAIANNNLITMTYLDSVGDLANKANTFAIIDTVGGFSNVAVQSVAKAAGGAQKETIEQIRFRSPYAYTAQNRAVTVNDYNTLLLKDYPNIDAVSVWPGDENDPPVYGKVFVSLKPKQDYILTNKEKERITNEIIANRSVLTVTPEIVDPDYMYLLVDARVNYDPSLLGISESALESVIRSSILQYSNDVLNNFDSVYVDSKLQNYIDTSHPAIIGSYLNTTTQKRIQIYTNQIKAYTADYGVRLHRGSIDDRFNIYPKLGVYDPQGIYREVFIEDTPNSLTGIESIQMLSGGTGYTSVPTVTITGDGIGATATAKVVAGQIQSITVDNRGSDYTNATVTISGGGGTGALAQITIQSRIGTLRSFYYKDNGEKFILNPAIGTIDYIAGVVKLSPISINTVPSNDRYPQDIVAFNASPYEGIIVPTKNRILTIDGDDPVSIKITLIPKTR